MVFAQLDKNFNNEPITVFVKADEETFAITSMSPSSTVMELKKKIEQVVRMPLLEQRLLLDGKPLFSHDRLHDTDIVNETFV